MLVGLVEILDSTEIVDLASVIPICPMARGEVGDTFLGGRGVSWLVCSLLWMTVLWTGEADDATVAAVLGGFAVDAESVLFLEVFLLGADILAT